MIDGAWLVLRAVALVLVLQAVGGGLFVLTFGRRLSGAAPAVRSSTRRVSLGALIVSAVQILAEPLHLAGDVSGLTDPAILRLLLHSATGVALGLRLAGVACVALALRQGASAARVPMLLGALLTLASFLLTGHVAVDPHRALLAPLLAAHVAIAAFWLGALAPLRQALRLQPPEEAARLLVAFSAPAVWLVPALGLAGVGMASLLLPGVAALWRPWGLLVLTKGALFLVLLALAALNRLRLTPALVRVGAPGAAALSRTIALEYLLICMTLAVTAVLTGGVSPRA
jgi:putative copper resistance protein D